MGDSKIIDTPEAGECRSMKGPGPPGAIWDSVHGEIVRGSLQRDGDQLTAVVFERGRGNVKIASLRKDISARIEAAAAAGDPVILQGHVSKGLDDLTSLDVRIEGPVELVGVVSSLDEALFVESPRLGFWMIREIVSQDGTTYRIGTGVNLFGLIANAAKHIRPGNRISIPARYGKEGFIALGPPRILPARPR